MANDPNLINNPASAAATPAQSSTGAPAGGMPTPSGEPPPFSLKGAPGTPTPTGPSPIQVATPTAAPQGPVSVVTLQQQTAAVQQQYGSVIAQLQDPVFSQGGTLKPSTVSLLQQHVNQSAANLASITASLGLPPPLQPPTVQTGPGAVSQFLDYLTGSQQELGAMTDELGAQAGKLGPADLMRVQYKMSGVQQQMEFFSVLLGKAVDNIKTVMNIQN